MKSTKESPPQFYLRDFTRLLPATYHPDAAEVLRESNKWATENLRFAYNSDQDFQEFIGYMAPMWPIVTVPNSRRRERLRAVCDLTHFIIAIDDTFSAASPGCRTWTKNQPDLARTVAAGLVAVMTGTRPEPGFDLGRVYSELWDRLRSEASTRLRLRMSKVLSSFIKANAEEVAFRTSAVPIRKSLLRRVQLAASAGRIFPVFAEHQLDIDLSHHMQQSAALRSIPELVMSHQVLVNDLFSYRKESLLSDDSRNRITEIQRRTGAGLQAAVDALCDSLEVVERRIGQKKGLILSGPLAAHPEVRIYLNEVRHMLSGSIEWDISCTTRYRGRDQEPWDGLTQAVATLHSDRTEITPLQ